MIALVDKYSGQRKGAIDFLNDPFPVTMQTIADFTPQMQPEEVQDLCGVALMICIHQEGHPDEYCFKNVWNTMKLRGYPVPDYDYFIYAHYLDMATKIAKHEVIVKPIEVDY